MTILVAGGAGYIGSHTVKELRPGGLRRPRPRQPLERPAGARRRASRSSRATFSTGRPCGSVFREHEIGAVLHFASLIQVGESYADPRKYYTHNLTTSLNLLDAMLEAGTQGPHLLLDGGGLRRTPRNAHPREPSGPAGQSLRPDQAHGRGHPPGLRTGPRPALDLAPLLQRRRGGPRRARRANATTRKPTSSPTSSSPPREAAPRSGSSGRTSPPPTARPSGTTSTSPTWPRPMSWP